MFMRLPSRIKNDILISGYRDVMSNIPLFRYIKNTSIKLFLLQIMTPMVAVTGRRIIREGKMGSDILFLVEGRASIYNLSEPIADHKTHRCRADPAQW